MQSVKADGSWGEWIETSIIDALKTITAFDENGQLHQDYVLRIHIIEFFHMKYYAYTVSSGTTLTVIRCIRRSYPE